MKLSPLSLDLFGQSELDLIDVQLDNLANRGHLQFLTKFWGEVESEFRVDSGAADGRIRAQDHVVFIRFISDKINISFYGKKIRFESGDRIEPDSREPSETETASSQRCNTKALYKLKLPREAFEITFNTTISSDVSILFVTYRDCFADSSKGALDARNQVSFSVVSLFIMNYMELSFLNIINNKDMLEIIFLDESPKTQYILTFFKYLDTFDCGSFSEYYSLHSSYLSNHRVRARLTSVPCKAEG